MKKLNTLLVFSVYSHVLEDYPYFPFVACDISEGIKKFIRFCNSRSSICEGAELHWIGTCERYYDKGDDVYGFLENIQPLMFPQRVIFKRDFLGRIISKLYVLGVIYYDKVVKFLSTSCQKKGN